MGCSSVPLCGFVRVNPGPMFSQRHRDTEEGSVHSRDEPQRAAESHRENSWGASPGKGSGKAVQSLGWLFRLSGCSIRRAQRAQLQSRRSRRDRPTFPFRVIRAIRSFGCWLFPLPIPAAFLCLSRVSARLAGGRNNWREWEQAAGGRWRVSIWEREASS